MNARLVYENRRLKRKSIHLAQRFGQRAKALKQPPETKLDHMLWLYFAFSEAIKNLRLKGK